MCVRNRSYYADRKASHFPETTSSYFDQTSHQRKSAATRFSLDSLRKREKPVGEPAKTHAR